MDSSEPPQFPRSYEIRPRASRIVWKPEAVRAENDVIPMNHVLKVVPRTSFSRRAVASGRGPSSSCRAYVQFLARRRGLPIKFPQMESRLAAAPSASRLNDPLHPVCCTSHSCDCHERASDRPKLRGADTPRAVNACRHFDFRALQRPLIACDQDDAFATSLS